jgi:hypothetical protein
VTPSRPPSLAVLTTRADEIRADVLVRVFDAAPMDDGGGASLSGSLTGPHRGRDTTLPTRVPLRSCADGAAAARASFTEPAFWTPEMPNLYRLEAQLLHGDRPVSAFDCMVGLRRLGIRRRSLWLDGRRWVPRVVGMTGDAFAPQLLRGLHAAAEIRDPDASLLTAADEAGVAIVCRLEDAAGRPFDGETAARRIAAWSLHPAAMIAVVPRGTPDVAAAIRVAAAGMLVAVEVDGAQPPEAVAAERVAAADCIVVDLLGEATPHGAWRDPGFEKPLVARSRGPESPGHSRADDRASPDALRRECDRLQARLAAWEMADADGRMPRDWAGYVVAAW